MPESPSSGPAAPNEPAKDAFAWLITDVVRVLLKDKGFSKNALTFVRRRGDLIDVINIQGSTRNGLVDHSFFINVAILSESVLGVLGLTVPQRPKEIDGLYRKRVSDISGSQVDRIDITPTTDRVALADFVRSEFTAALNHLDRIGGTSDLLDLVVERNFAHHSDVIAGYLVRIGDDDRLIRYLTTLRDRLASQSNWLGIATRLRLAMGERAPAAALQLLPEEIAPGVTPPHWLT